MPLLARPADDVITLNPLQSPENVMMQTWYLQDTNHQLTLEDVRQSPDFERNTRSMLNFGLRGPVVWLRLEVANIGKTRGEWVIGLNRALLDELDVYVHRSDLLEHPITTSNPDSIFHSYATYASLAAPLTLEAEETATIYIRYLPPNWSGMPLEITDRAEFLGARQARLLLFVAVLVGVTASVFYTTIPFIFMGRDIFFYYASGQLGLFTLYMHMEGITTVYLWPDDPAVGRNLATIAGIAFNICMPQFARLFFDLKNNLPRVDAALKWLIYLQIAGTLLIVLNTMLPLVPRNVLGAFTYSLPIFVWLILPLLAVYATWRISRYNWPIIIAWFSMGSFTIGSQFVFFGVLPQMPFGMNIYNVTIAVEAVCLSIAIMLRVRELQMNQLIAQQELSASLETQLAVSQERAVALEDAAEKGKLLLAAGHDSRQLLFALRNFAYALKSGAPGTENVDEKIDDIAQHLDDVLSSAIGGAQTGGIDDTLVALDQFSPRELINTMSLIHESSATRKGLKFRTHTSVSPLVTDRVLVSRVLSNFVYNAIKYTGDGGVLVAIRQRRRALFFEVWDSGQGLTSEQIETLESDTANRFDDATDGHGAGLVIAHKIARRLGGRIEIRSRVGQGSLFRLVLPVMTPERGLIRNLSSRPVSLPAGLTIAEGSDAQPDVVLFEDEINAEADPDKLVREARSGGFSGPVACLLYDKSAETRKKWSGLADYLVYQPCTEAAIAELIRLSRLRA